MGLSEAVASESAAGARNRSRTIGALCATLLGLAVCLAFGARQAAAAESCGNEATRVGPSADLPDCRAYEMVSPVEKAGQDVVASPVFGFDSVPVISMDGEVVAFESYGAFAEPHSNGVISNYLARRGSGNWQTEQISPPIEPNPSLNTAAAEAYTPDFAMSAILGPWNPPLVPGASPGTSNLYLRDNSDGSLRLVSAGAPPELGQEEWAPVAVSADGSHVIFGANGVELTPDASETTSPFLYDWDTATETVTLEARLPDESVSPAPVTLAGQTGFGGSFNPAHPISSNGSHVFFETLGHEGTQQVFVRVDGSSTQEVSESQRTPAATAHPSHLQLATNDGGLAFITSSELLTDDATTGEIGEDLYRYDVATEQLTDLTPDAAEEGVGGARVQGVLGGSGDGSRIYFVAQGVLATGATAGENNLYLWTEGEGTEFIATGTGEFARNWSPSNRASRVTPDGMHLAFTADNSLTGYPNEGRPEIYLFDAGSGELVCASCHPGGVPALLGAAIEGRTENIGFLSRNLSDDGRFVFFNTNEALVPRDTNNGEDAYEFDSTTGQVSLISTGTSAQGEMFTDASPSGRDALILTRKQLVGVDQDENVDSYDARIEGGIAAQNPGPPAPPCSSATECREPGFLPAPPVAASANLFGSGNVKAKKKKHKNTCKAKHKRAHKKHPRANGSKKAKKCKRSHRRAGR
jgi:hypothetical protein